MSVEVDYIKLRPDRIGWTLILYTGGGVFEFEIGDAIQFQAEVERTIGKWLADGPADFHGTTEIPNLAGPDYDLARDIERGK